MGAARGRVERGSLCQDGDHGAQAVELDLGWGQTVDENMLL